jgi:hypothetical protein
MPAAILKLLTLVALALMPFGMSAASAAPVHHAPAAGAARHCDEQGGQPAQTSSDKALDCAMACSMLVAAEARVEEPAPAVRLPAGRKPAERATGLHPDTATPPPKLS